MYHGSSQSLGEENWTVSLKHDTEIGKNCQLFLAFERKNANKRFDNVWMPIGAFCS